MATMMMTTTNNTLNDCVLRAKMHFTREHSRVDLISHFIRQFIQFFPIIFSYQLKRKTYPVLMHDSHLKSYASIYLFNSDCRHSTTFIFEVGFFSFSFCERKNCGSLFIQKLFVYSFGCLCLFKTVYVVHQRTKN